MSALGYVLMLIEIPIPALIPEFVKFDLSETASLIAAYITGPVGGATVCLIKNLLKLTASNTGGVGELCNFMLGVCLAVPAGLIYRRDRSLRGALIGGAVGAVIMAALSVPINYFVAYPVYEKFLPIEEIVGMYRAILPSVNGLLECLMIFNAPFTLIKAALSAGLAAAVARRVKL